MAEVCADVHARIAAYCRRVSDDAPPLTVEQRDRLALLLKGKGEAALDIGPLGADVLSEMMGA